MIFKMEVLARMRAIKVVRGDSYLVVSQATRAWEVRELALQGYKEKLRYLKSTLKELFFIYVPRPDNVWVNTLPL